VGAKEIVDNWVAVVVVRVERDFQQRICCSQDLRCLVTFVEDKTKKIGIGQEASKGVSRFRRKNRANKAETCEGGDDKLRRRRIGWWMGGGGGWGWMSE
jgi:hypothetical protein